MKKPLFLAIVSSVLIALFSCTKWIPVRVSEERVPEENGVNVLMLIKNADTPEEHMKLAKYFEKQAAEMERESSVHETMARLYKDTKKISEAYEHCRDISKNYKETAEGYRSLSLLHRVRAYDVREEK